MRYTVSAHQFDYFRKEGFIEFEALYNKEEAETLRLLLDEVLKKHLGPKQEPSLKTLAAGYDLHRENPALVKALFLSKLGQLGAALFTQKKLKVAFLLYYPCYATTASIEDVSSVTETVGGLLIHLSPSPLPDLPYLPHEFGSGVFYSPHFPINFSMFDHTPVLLLVFSNDKARYKLQEKDPLTHALKKLGYGFGDHLTVETHPFIFQRI